MEENLYKKYIFLLNNLNIKETTTKLYVKNIFSK